jgi:hypothetical protein
VFLVHNYTAANKRFRIALLIYVVQHPMHTLQHFNQQLQATHGANVAGYLRAIHTQLARLQLKSG